MPGIVRGCPDPMVAGTRPVTSAALPPATVNRFIPRECMSAIVPTRQQYCANLCLWAGPVPAMLAGR